MTLSSRCPPWIAALCSTVRSPNCLTETSLSVAIELREPFDDENRHDYDEHLRWWKGIGIALTRPELALLRKVELCLLPYRRYLSSVSGGDGDGNMTKILDDVIAQFRGLDDQGILVVRR